MSPAVTVSDMPGTTFFSTQSMSTLVHRSISWCTTIGSSTLTSGTTFVLRRALKLKGLEYPRDYKLLSVGGTTEAFMAMNAGQTAASMMAVPYAFRAQDLGFNLIGRMADVFPNYLLSAFSVRRSWAEKNRPAVVRFQAESAGTANLFQYQRPIKTNSFLSISMEFIRKVKFG